MRFTNRYFRNALIITLLVVLGSFSVNAALYQDVCWKLSYGQPCILWNNASSRYEFTNISVSGVVSSVSAGSGLFGGVITSNGTISLNDSYVSSLLSNSTIARVGSCPSGKVVQNTTTGGVQCVNMSSGNGTVTSVGRGFGLNGSGTAITTSGTIDVNDSVIQRRVGSSCATSNAIRVSGQDGTVTCEPITASGGGGWTNTSSTVYLSNNASNVSVNNSVFFIDTKKGLVGIGTSIPTASLHIVGNTPVDIGSELVTNGDFASNDTGWTKDEPSSWNWSSGAEVHNDSDVIGNGIFQNIAVSAGRAYHIKATIGGTVGNVYICVNTNDESAACGGVSFGSSVDYTIISDGGSQLYFFPDLNFSGTIDDVSVKEAVGEIFEVAKSDGSSALHVNTGGYVGIGTTTPGAPLDTNGLRLRRSNGGYLQYSFAGDNRWALTDSLGYPALRGEGNCANPGIGFGQGIACESAIFNYNPDTTGTGQYTVISVGENNNNLGLQFGAGNYGNANMLSLYLDKARDDANATYQFHTERVADSVVANQPSILLDAQTIKFGTGSVSSSLGTQRMIIDSSGKVGINTTAPVATLDVRGTALFNLSGVTNAFQIQNTSGTAILNISGANGQVWINNSLVCTSANGVCVTSDQNNYTSSISFGGAVLTLARNGGTSLTATIPNNALTSDAANITAGTLVNARYNQSYFSLLYVNRTDWTSIDAYPAACGAGTAVTTIGDTLTCTPFASSSNAAGWFNTSLGIYTSINTTNVTIDGGTFFANVNDNRVGINTLVPTHTLTVNGSFNLTGGVQYVNGTGFLAGNTSCVSIVSPGGGTRWDVCN